MNRVLRRAIDSKAARVLSITAGIQFLHSATKTLAITVAHAWGSP